MKHEHIKITTCVKGTLLARSLIIEPADRQPTTDLGFPHLSLVRVSERARRTAEIAKPNLGD